MSLVLSDEFMNSQLYKVAWKLAKARGEYDTIHLPTGKKVKVINANFFSIIHEVQTKTEKLHLYNEEE